MSDTKGLIERLRDAAWAGPIPCPVCDEAADTIARLEEANEAFGRRQVWWTDRMFELEEKVARLEAERDAVLRALEALDPHLDAIVCYASTTGEHEPNRLAADARAVVAKHKEKA